MEKNKYEELYENIINGTYNKENEQRKSEQNRNMFYLVRELNENPNMLENVKKMMDYRDLRTKQSWLSNFYYNSNKFNDGELKIQTLRNEVSRLDRDRRKYHNSALASFYSLVNDMKQNGIPPIYKGRIMNPFDDKVNRYGDPNIRQEMTDGFLGMLYSISETTIGDLGLEQGEYSEGVESFRKIVGQLRHQNNSYGVEEPLKEDEGEPKFRDDNKKSNFYR